MDVLPDGEVEEKTSGLISGLKSWLNFGSTMAPSGGGMDNLENNRMADLINQTQAAVDYKREGGVSTASADDRLTKRAEEQAKKVFQNSNVALALTLDAGRHGFIPRQRPMS